MAQRETRCLRALDTTEGGKFGVGVVFNMVVLETLRFISTDIEHQYDALEKRSIKQAYYYC